MTTLAETDLLLKQYQPLVVSLARRCLSKLPPSVELDDLVQVGMIGLYQSLSRFDDSLGVRFDVYATQRISGAMIDELRENDFMSRSLRKDQKTFSKVILKLEHEFGRKPRDSEIAARLTMTLAEYQKTAACVHDAYLVHFEDMCEEDEESLSFLDRHLGDLISDPLNLLEVSRTRFALAFFIGLLSKRDQQIMSMYYEKDLTLKDIALIFGLTEARVSQIISKTVQDLRRQMKDYGAGETRH